MVRSAAFSSKKKQTEPPLPALLPDTPDPKDRHLHVFSQVYPHFPVRPSITAAESSPLFVPDPFLLLFFSIFLDATMIRKLIPFFPSPPRFE